MKGSALQTSWRRRRLRIWGGRWLSWGSSWKRSAQSGWCWRIRWQSGGNEHTAVLSAWLTHLSPDASRLADALPGRSAVPREAEGDRPAGPGTTSPDAESCSPAEAAREGPHSSTQPSGSTPTFHKEFSFCLMTKFSFQKVFYFIITKYLKLSLSSIYVRIFVVIKDSE